MVTRYSWLTCCRGMGSRSTSPGVLCVPRTAQEALPGRNPQGSCDMVAAHLLQRCGQDPTDGPRNEAATGEHQSQAPQRQNVGTQRQGQQDEDPAADHDGVRHKVCTAPVWLSARCLVQAESAEPGGCATESAGHQSGQCKLVSEGMGLAGAPQSPPSTSLALCRTLSGGRAWWERHKRCMASVWLSDEGSALQTTCRARWVCHKSTDQGTPQKLHESNPVPAQRIVLQSPAFELFW